DHHSHAEGESHHHHGGGLFGERSELIFSIICGGFLALGFAFTFISVLPAYVSIILYGIACFFGGFYTTKEAYEGISNGRFEIDFLMMVAAVGAAILGHWAEAALLLFLFSLGHSLEHYSFEKARKSIAALGNLSPKTGLLKNGDQLIETKIEDLKPGDIIIVKSNSIIAADGIVISGRSSVNQAPITGESMPVEKSPVENENVDISNFQDERHGVFAGTINGIHTLEIKVTRLAKDSTISRLVELVNEAQTQKSPTQTFTDKIEKYYVPAVLVLVGVLMFAFLVINESFGASFYRAMAVLVAASPCALALATPSAVLSGVARAARSGVLIKGGRPLEELGRINAIAFDKTGTLTQGKPQLTGIYPLNDFAEKELLEILIAVEKLSDHPLSVAIVNGAKEKLKEEVTIAKSLESISGRGVKAYHKNNVIHIGNLSLFINKKDKLSDQITRRVTEYEKEGNTTIIVQQDQKFIGIVTVKDVSRKEATETLLALKKLGIKKMVMLTGDNQLVADSIARELGITEAVGGLLPEQKVEAIEKLMAEGKVAMVGDGVNDAPAMAKSSVGIAMGAAGSDVALETADIALMADNLSTLPFAIGLSKKASAIIRQNLIISIGMVLLLLPLTISGIATIGPAVIGHEGSTLVVVFNALRLLGYKAPKM
ncbi:MAG: heavy metal translocating P-type ATPase, partial [Ginsengibacter sp.]